MKKVSLLDNIIENVVITDFTFVLDEDSKAGSAVTAVEITRFATDRANSVATVIVPLIFFGEHDPEENLNKIMESRMGKSYFWYSQYGHHVHR